MTHVHPSRRPESEPMPVLDLTGIDLAAERASESWPRRRRELVEQHLPLVGFVARDVARYRPVTSDELIADGVFGLIDALERFDPDRGPSFESYARLRIKGAIFDGLRSADPLSRRTRRGVRSVQAAEAELTQQLGEAPTPERVSAEVGRTVEQVRALQGYAQRCRPAMALEEELVTEVTPGPDEAFARQEELRALRVAIDGLSDRHRTIVIESFFEGRTMREIGDDLGVTESRVSQLRSAALATLRSHLTSH